MGITTRQILVSSLLLFGMQVAAFVGPSSRVVSMSRGSILSLNLVDGSSVAELSNAMAPALLSSSPGLILAETEAWVKPTAVVLGPFLNFLSFAMVRCAYFHASQTIDDNLLMMLSHSSSVE